MTWILVLASPAQVQKSNPEQALILQGAQVWNGVTFEARELYTSGGLFVESPVEGALTLDLSGRYLVPPLAEAHTHRFSTAYDAPSGRSSFLSEGILYAANLCCPQDARQQCEPFANGPEDPDVLWTGGGLTSTKGHPIALYRNLHETVYRRPPETFWEENAGNTFFVVDEASQIDAAWEQLLKGEPDLVKTLLSSSESHGLQAGDPGFTGYHGLNPVLLPRIVELAHAEGLRVVTHVDTRQDFLTAVKAGVDMTAHTPGYVIAREEDWETFALLPEDGELARRSGLQHITTASVARSELGWEMMRENLAVLLDAGVPLLVGSDVWEGAAAMELEALMRTELFSVQDLLRMWCTETPRALFPDREIGALELGHEANWCVLSGDPRVASWHLITPQSVYKAGRRIWERAESE